MSASIVEPGTCSGSCACNTISEEELLARLDEIISENRDGPGNLIPVLQITQGLFGYLPEEALHKIATAFDTSYTEVAGVVSFYSFFTTVPRGQHTIRVCLGTACYVRGGKEVLASLKQTLGIDVGQTTNDRLFSLDVGRCFGACGLSPVVMVDDEIYQRVKPSKIHKILDQYKGGAHE